MDSEPASEVFETSGSDETEALAERFAARLRAGDAVLVSGEVGAGKTTFVRGACHALGVTEQVRSPTFVLAHRYSGRLPVAHLDLYRLAGLDAEDDTLLDDYLTEDAVAFVEWPQAGAERLALWGRVHSVLLAHAGGDVRRIEIAAVELA